MHVCGGTHKEGSLPWDRGAYGGFINVLTWGRLESPVLNLGFKIGVATLRLWVWVEVEGFRGCWICKLEIWGLFVSSSWFEIRPHTWILTSRWIGDFSPRRLILLDVPTPLFNRLALVVTAILSGGRFSILVAISAILVVMTTFAHKTTCTRFGKHLPPLHWLWHRKLFTMWMRPICFYCAQPNKALSATKSSWAQNSEGVSRSCSCCKHDMHWQVETQDAMPKIQSTPKMLCTVVANESCVVVCKPKWHGWHQMYLRVGWWASMYNSNLKSGRFF